METCSTAFLNFPWRPHAWFVLGIVVLTCYGCGAYTPVNPDPCGQAKRVEAQFTIYEPVGDLHPRTDTILWTSIAHFSADEHYDKYEWHIGFDSRIRMDSSFSLRFPASQVEEGVSIPITFIGSRTPNLMCFPDDDGLDTITRQLVVLSPYNSPVLGSYKGCHLDNPADTFTVDIFWQTEDFLTMRNINRGCMDTAQFRLSSVVSKVLGATSMEFDGEGGYDKSGCKNPKGTLLLTEHGRKVEIVYVYDKERIPKTFVGWRN